jgi:hypothetical protein
VIAVGAQVCAMAPPAAMASIKVPNFIFMVLPLQ